MQVSSTVGYAERIERAIALLEQKTAAGLPPSLSELASAAALSPFHFHRIFRVMTGESVGSAVARVRLGGALPLLDRSILDAVSQSGYATSQAFARARSKAEPMRRHRSFVMIPSVANRPKRGSLFPNKRTAFRRP
ncbi:helix-turn-helix domain-containing protein [Croceicoccus hydrothermalis]|uniref:helix-turn-helix domain-containing protein n=1 Tax=Croceicoccus hydrothermalis TaxID=2867964 RepID=UPI001EFC20CF|nr:AraC family transcriptional regulator [Croceicoccus hydrothermalis]